MEVNLVILGLLFDIVGVSILVITVMFDPSYRKREDLKWWEKRYSWDGWRPIFKVRPPSEKARWMVKWTHKVVREGFILPKHCWNIIGFLCILGGFILQLKFYLS